MGNIFGQAFKITTWGESHGDAVGVIIDGCPPGIEITAEEIQADLNRRKPGQSEISTQRKEGDQAEITSGIFDGQTFILETAFKSDFAFIKAWKGDTLGNLVYKGTARNFNPMMATAGKITIVEVEHLVEVGELDPNEIHTPNIYVNRIFEGQNYEKRIEKITTQ